LIAVAMVAAPNVEQQQNPIPLIEELIVPAALAGPGVTAAAAPAVAQVAATPEASRIAALVAVAAATPVAGGRVFAVPGGGGFPEGIAYDAATGDFYVGSTIDGTIYRGNVVSGTVEVFLPGEPRLVAYGLALDEEGRLFVAGGQTGFVAVYDTDTRQRLAELGNGLAPNTFLTDVAVTPDGTAYITDAFNPILWRFPASALPTDLATPGAAVPIADGALEIFLDLSASAAFLAGGFNANGIIAAPNGQFLLVVQSDTGALYRIDVGSGEVNQVNLGGSVLTAGSDLALEGQTLSVVTGEAIMMIELAGDFLSGSVGASVTDPSFAAPTSLARHGGCLLVVNSQLDRLEGEPQLPFTVSSVSILRADATTPVTTRPC
jgi:sugar lactone lactonase YvrE